MQIRTIAVGLVAAALAAVSPAPAQAAPIHYGPLTVTGALQPTAVSAYGGAAARIITVHGKKRVQFTRFVDGQLDRTLAGIRGRIVRGVAINDAGTIVVMGARELRHQNTCQIWAATWPAGAAKAAWEQIGTVGVCFANATIPILTDDAGDFVAHTYDPDAGADHSYFVLPHGGTWRAKVSLAQVGNSVMFGMDLSPDGDIVALWVDEHTSPQAISLTTRGVLATSWTTTKDLGGLPSHTGYPAGLDAGLNGNVGFATPTTEGKTYIGQVTATGSDLVALPARFDDRHWNIHLVATDDGAVRAAVEHGTPGFEQSPDPAAALVELSGGTITVHELTLDGGWPNDLFLYGTADEQGSVAIVGRTSKLGPTNTVLIYSWPSGGDFTFQQIPIGTERESDTTYHLFDSGLLWWSGQRANLQRCYFVTSIAPA